MRHVAYLALSLLLLSSPAGSQPAGAAPLEDPTYAALRSARPDGETLVLSQPFTLERDAFRFDLASGSLHFLAPVDGRRVGVVFLGEGTFRLIPSTEDERRHLALVTGDDHLEVLKDSFRSLVLLFADDTAEELGQLGALEHRAPEPKAVEAYESFLAHQRRDFEVNFHARLLQDLLNTPELKSGVFLAYLDGEALPPAVAAVDPRGAEALGVGLLLGGEDSLLFVGDEVKGGFWYLCDRAGEIRTGRRSPYRPTVEALHYAIDTEVRRNEELVGTTELQLKAQSALRVVPLELASTLRLKQALYRKEGESEWVPVAFVQEKEKEDANPAVVLPETLAKGAVFELRLGYSGKEVVFDLGDGVFAVLARTSWYPNVGTFRDLADYDLTFHVPAGNEVRSVGRPLETKTEGGVLTSRWRTEGPVRVAGFNYGKFKTRERRDEVSGVTVKVLATEKGFQLVGGGSRAETVDVDFSPDSLGVVDANQQPVVGRSASKSVVDSVAIDGVNALRLYHTYFGPLPYTEVAVTQQSFFGFGQSWPTLIYMPYLAFLSSATRNVVGATGTGIDDFVEQVGFHEMAHQWWGHLVGWDSYRDQWLSEGFAEFSAALAVQHTQGWEAYGKGWKQ
ncbi:MAG TPA: M1 family aminopeptidase, partial [Thermoanaerobaculia bacterium]|nr:M1 family aminopeptidase [Thermoanaerobaculia bacterium]